jgi:hypothetical protein
MKNAVMSDGDVVRAAVLEGFRVLLPAMPAAYVGIRPKTNKFVNDARAAYVLLRREMEPMVNFKKLASELGRSVPSTKWLIERGMQSVRGDKEFARKLRVALETVNRCKKNEWRADSIPETGDFFSESARNHHRP